MLTNPRAERVKAVRALGRRSSRLRAGRFVAEGPQAVRELLGFRPESALDVYLERDGEARHTALIEAANAAEVPVHECSAEVLAAMSDTQHPQGILAVCRPVDVPLADALDKDSGFVVVLTHVRDPGNAGTVIRGADAAGARCVVVSDASVDIYNPKVVRSTVGSLWHLPIATGETIEAILAACRERGLKVLAADGTGTDLLTDVDLTVPHAWVMGNEAWGLDARVRQMCDQVVRVPIYGHAESLNLAMAATCCMYASAGAL